jgi:hypothetical protein
VQEAHAPTRALATATTTSNDNSGAGAAPVSCFLPQAARGPGPQGPPPHPIPWGGSAGVLVARWTPSRSQGPASGQPARAVPQAGPVVLGWAAYQQGERKTGRTWGTCHPAIQGDAPNSFSELPAFQAEPLQGAAHLVSGVLVLACPRPAPAPAACCTSDLGPTTGGRARYPVSSQPPEV